MTSAGITLNYCVETTAGTKPTSGFTKIPDVKAIPSATNPEPNALESTTLEETEWKTYELGLKDPGGVWGFDANLTSALKTIWDAMVTASHTGAASNKATWFEIKIPGFNSFYFKGEPAPLGFNGASVDAILETTLYVAPTNISGFAAAST